MGASMFDVLGVGRRSSGLRGLGSTTDELDRVLAEAAAQSPQMASLSAEARAQVEASIARNSESLNTVGSVMVETEAIISAATSGPEKERIANAAVGVIATAANAVYPGIGSAMAAAVKILWRLLNPAVRALSRRLAYITRGDAYRNAFLNITGYASGSPVGGRGKNLNEEALAEAFRDGWYIIQIGPSSGYYWRAESWITAAADWSSMGTASAECASPVLVGLAGSTLRLLRESARSVDAMYGRGEADAARDLWAKTLALFDQVFLKATDRFVRLSGIRPGACVGLVSYPWGSVLAPGGGPMSGTGSGMIFGACPRTKEEAASSGHNLVVLGGVFVNQTFGGDPERGDMIAFKPSRIPPDVAVAVAHNIFTDTSRYDMPCDAAIQRFALAGQGRYDESTGWPMSIWGMRLIEDVYKSRGGSGGPPGAPSGQKLGWSTTKKVVVAGAAVGVPIGTYLLGRALGWWK